MMKLASIRPAALLALVLFATPALAQPTLSSSTPARNARSAPRATNVDLTFSAPMQATTAARVRVFSSLGGRKLGTTTTSGATISFNPTTDFRPGEVVSVSVPPTVRGTDGVAARRHVYQFTTAAAPSAGQLGWAGIIGEAYGGGCDGLYDPPSVLIADFNGDGRLDCASELMGYMAIYTNNGNVTNQYSWTWSSNVDLGYMYSPSADRYRYVLAGDMDGDGDSDLAHISSNLNTPAVRLNDGTGQFGAPIISSISGADHLQLGDIDGDGDLDVIAGGAGAGAAVSVGLNNGLGQLTAGYRYPTPTTSLAVADVDNDGDLDLLTANATSDSVRVRLNNGLGTAFVAAGRVRVGARPGWLQTADVDGDGDLDLLTANRGGTTVSIRLNNGLGSFSGSQEVNFTIAPDKIALGDIDGDGDLDLLVTAPTISRHYGDVMGGAFIIRLNNGSGVFGGGYSLGTGPGEAALGDFDGDGDLDVMAGTLSELELLINKPAPAITSFSPTSGSTGTIVTLTGTNLADVTTIRMGSYYLLPVLSASATQIQTMIPAGAVSAPIVVGDPNSLMTASTPTSFIVTTNITDFTPTRGGIGTIITISGTGFTGVTGAWIGPQALTNLVVVSPTQLRATVPAGTATGVVRVTNANGSPSSVNSFTMLANPPPQITGFAPLKAAVGTVVTITGAGLVAPTRVLFNGVVAAFTSVSATSLRATVPAGATSGYLVVETAFGSTTSAQMFGIPPVITGFSPTSGPVGTTVVVSGTGLSECSARFTGAAVSVISRYPTTLGLLVPPLATTGPFTLTSFGGTVASATSFVVTRGAAITRLSPTTGVIGLQTRITGVGMTNVTEVWFGSLRAPSFTAPAATYLLVTIPPGSVTSAVRLVTPDGPTYSAAPYPITLPAVPTITSFTPTSGRPSLATAVTITGTGLTGPTGVRFNGVAATFTSLSATQVRATVPTGATTGAISISTAGGTATSAATFTVTGARPGPVVASISEPAPEAGLIRLSPNPATGAVRVTSTPGKLSACAELISPLGVVLTTTPLVANEAVFDLRGQPAGLYTVRVGRQVSRLVVE